MSQPPPPDESSTDKLRRLIASESGSASGATSDPKPTQTPPETPSSEPRTTPQPPPTAGAKKPSGHESASAESEDVSATPIFPKVHIDEHGMPLPRRVPEQDPDATRVQQSAIWYWDSRQSRRQHAHHPDQVLSAEPLAPTRATTPPTRRWAGCLWKVLVNAVIIGGFALFVTMGALGYAYWAIARDLPPIGDLRARASQFETTRVYDARGQLLQDIADPQSGFRTRVSLGQVSPYLIAATIATEDKNFFSHPGFDPIGIVRAILQNVEAGDTVSGASTITQQLVRALVLSPEERGQRTAMRKIREIILAAEITRRYSKQEILELYLNEIYYGNLAYGIEAASETYFDKRASDLNLAEASFLAGLPQAPAVYDVYTDPEAAFTRQRDVLFLMLALSQEAGCIRVDPDAEGQKVCVADSDVPDAALGIRGYPFVPPRNDARFPHWVNYIRQLLEEQYGAQTIYRSGYNVYTTLDPELQAQAEAIVAEQVAALADRHVTNGALVAVRPGTGEIVTMVGSDNYDDPVDGQINMAIRPRQPGSSIKPLTYALAFEKGWTPATLIWDVPSEFPDGANPPYKPVNYDGRFHGPVLARYALANSYNIPAVKALQFVGLYEEGGFLQFAPQLGITTLDRPDYGLSVTLGGGEVTPLQMAGAYATLAHNGQRVFPIAIREIRDSAGNLVCQQPLQPAEMKTDPPPCQTPPENWGAQAVSAENAYLISHILSDNDARTPAFGPNSQLRLSFAAAAKTGTTNDYRDNWTIGFTPDLAVSVWVGNADYTPMERTTGVSGAAPIWHNFMEAALAGRATPFVRPPGIVERNICGLSGAEPSDFCPPNFHRLELFAESRLPLPKERDLWRQAFIDPFTNLEQTADCAGYYQNDALFNQGRTVIAVSDPWAQKWLVEDPNGQAWAAEHGINPPIAWAPTGQCTTDSPHPVIGFAFPPEGGTIPAGPIQILGQAAATGDFDFYVVEYGISHDPQGWGPILGPNTNPVAETGPLANWDAGLGGDGPVTLRIVVFSKSGGSAEARVHFHVQAPTPSPTPSGTVTPVPTSTPTLAPTATVTATPTPSDTPVATETPTETPVPSDTPTPTSTPTDTPTP